MVCLFTFFGLLNETTAQCSIIIIAALYHSKELKLKRPPPPSAARNCVKDENTMLANDKKCKSVGLTKNVRMCRWALYHTPYHREWNSLRSLRHFINEHNETQIKTSSTKLLKPQRSI